MDRVDAFICRATTAVSSNFGLAIVASMTLFWLGSAAWDLDPIAATDSLLSGGAFFVGLMIYREGSWRDKALHKKEDEIIRAIPGADDRLAGIEER